MADVARRDGQGSHIRFTSASTDPSQSRSRRASRASSTEDSGTIAFMATIPSWDGSFARIQMRINHRGRPRAPRIQIGDKDFLEVPGEIRAEFSPQLPKDTFSTMVHMDFFERLHNTRTLWGILNWDQYTSKISVTDWAPVEGFQNDGGETAWSGPLDTSKIWPKGLDRFGNPASEEQTRKTQAYLSKMYAGRYLRKVDQEKQKQKKNSQLQGRVATSSTSRVSAAA